MSKSPNQDVAVLPSAEQRERRRSWLRAIGRVALLDVGALAAYLIALNAGNGDFAFWAGFVCAIGFIALVVMTGVGATLGLWGWWYTALVFVTAGGLGALLGRAFIRRRGWRGAPPDPAVGFMVGGFGADWSHHDGSGSDLGGGGAGGGGDAGGIF